MNSDDNDLITPSENDQIVSKVFDECERIYTNPQPFYSLPWTTCTTCGEKHQCVCSVIDASAECHQCRFRRRVREERQKAVADHLERRAELLKDFAEI